MVQWRLAMDLMLDTLTSAARPRSLLAWVRQRFRRWLQQRLPRTDTLLLTQRNVYILPTRAGLMFAFTLLVLLLASINYQLNLGYVLTFLLAGSGVVSMHLTHNTLRGLTLHLKPGTSPSAKAKWPTARPTTSAIKTRTVRSRSGRNSPIG